MIASDMKMRLLLMRKQLALAVIALSVVVLPSVITAQHRTGSLWPKKFGVFTATSSGSIPAFPRAWSGYRPLRAGFNYWGEHFESSGVIRIGGEWSGIPDFPVTMNHCSDGVFMIRWRAASSDLRIASMLASQDINLNYMSDKSVKVGSYGYLYGFNCVQPAFKLSRAVNGNSSNIADIYYEVRFWQAAP